MALTLSSLCSESRNVDEFTYFGSKIISDERIKKRSGEQWEPSKDSFQQEKRTLYILQH